MKEKSFYLTSLGCAKNTVDSSSMAALLLQEGYTQVRRPSHAKLLIVNTCGFIQPSREEAIHILQELARKKRPGQFLVAAGCLTERFSRMVVEQVPQVDGILGTKNWMDIVSLAARLRAENPPKTLFNLPESTQLSRDEVGVSRATVQGGSAYLKIADGCHRPCAFCTIPLIKGTTTSRPVSAIIQDVQNLQEQGVQELILIAQDTTSYGWDLGLKDGLAVLLEEILKSTPHIPWIRLLYTYPGYVTNRLIELMASQPQILPYLDMPLQHAHPGILTRMRRPANMDWVYKTLEKMRKAIPGLTLRTTFIVGYPGETETEFQTLLDFVAEIRFDHVGVFPFSFEAGTASEPLGDPVPPEIKQERLEKVMLLQQDISQQNNQAQIGKTLQVIIEGREDTISVGRSYRDAPEIDGLIFAEGKAAIGKIVPVKITGALPYDLLGHIQQS
ncbi:MAG: 30S ribosomal protein S12 methylthiotransferase RimO [Anaerolineaceae bacterium]|nr:30S ribosomal protein S12 methylthiotransferase RimO [Anaerolineaceae bacterium]